MIFKPYGDSALLINFDQKIDPLVNAKVTSLDKAIKAARLPSIHFTIPAYCSLTIGYDKEAINYETLCLFLTNLQDQVTTNKQSGNRKLIIPVCYDAEYGLDLEALAKEKQLATEEIIAIHTHTTFQVYMLGFLPGFAYMGKLPDTLVCDRKQSPRVRIPALSVGLAGQQTGIYPQEAPGGWQIIGQTPIPIFRPLEDQPFLFQAGDQVQFKTIDKHTFLNISKDIAQEQFNWDNLYA